MAGTAEVHAASNAAAQFPFFGGPERILLLPSVSFDIYGGNATLIWSASLTPGADTTSIESYWSITGAAGAAVTPEQSDLVVPTEAITLSGMAPLQLAQGMFDLSLVIVQTDASGSAEVHAVSAVAILGN